jgi:hypothetical protein
MKKIYYVSGILSVLGLWACGKSSNDTNSAATGTSSGTTRVPGAGTNVLATNINELGLSGALKIELPQSLQGGTGLRLVGQKSIEACLMRESAKQLLQQIESATSTICHIEAEGKNIPWNKPVILDLAATVSELKLSSKRGTHLQGPPPGVDPNAEPPVTDPSAGSSSDPNAPGTSLEMPLLGIYVKEAAGGNVEVYLCSGKDKSSMSLDQSFKITGSKKVKGADGKEVNASAGKINISMDDFGTFKGSFAFDSLYSDPKASTLALEVKFGFDSDGLTSSFAQKFNFGEKDGLVKIGISEVGSMDFGEGGFEFKNAGVGLFDAQNGQVFYSYTGDGNEFATQACVDSQSYLVGCESAAKFAEGGTLYLTKDSVPGVLPKTYTPEGPSGFDCKPSEWGTVTPGTDEATMAAHEACMGDMSSDKGDGMASCFDAEGEYVKSSEVVEIEFEQVEAGSFENDITEYQTLTVRAP